MKKENLANKKIVVLGFGQEGQANFRFLRRNFPEMKIRIADRKEAENFDEEAKKIFISDKNLELFLGEKYLDAISDCEVVLRSPGLSVENIKGENLEITSGTDLFMNEVRGKVVGVTGTKGKSTTTFLINCILQEAGKKAVLIGNIGKPALDYLSEDSLETIFVFEMSSYQLENLTKPPEVAVFTSFFPDHMDAYPSLEEYFSAKTKIFGPTTHLFFNAGFEKLRNFFSGKKLAIAYNDEKNFVKEKKIYIDGKEDIDISQSNLLGKHNEENILGAVLVVKSLGIENSIIQRTLENFSNLEHRLEFVPSTDGIHYINDSACITPESGIYAIESFQPGEIGTLILGGLDRGYDFSKLAKVILENRIKAVIIFPETGEKIWQEIEKSKGELSLPEKITTNSMEEAVRICHEKTEQGKICLLSPASPSYNLYANFKERGNLFKEAIKKL